MALITINGVVVPTPTDLQVGKMDITKAQRNANGTMIIERIAQKTKISLTWSFVTASNMSKIMQAIDPVFYDVTYLDPVSNSNVTSSFYTGDKNMGMIDFLNGVPRYKDLKFDLIER